MSAAADWIDNLARLAEAATPGPWEATQEGLTHPDGWEIDAPDGPVVSECCGYRGSVGKTADAEFIAAANPATILRLIEELRKATRAAQTLGKVIEDQCRDVLNATGLYHLIDEDGDGDWGAVWDNLAEIAAERDQWREMYQAQVHLAHVSDMKVAAVEALADEWDKSDETHEWILAADLRAALTEQENDQ